MESALTLNHFLFVSGLLFAIGLAGVLLRRNLIVIFMCLELMLAAANLTLVAFSRHHLVAGQPDYEGHILLFFIITVAAAEVAVGLAIIVALFRSRETTDVTKIDSMKY
ncbi:MAG: NADH-quinone oxidoreductase subunit NuoK [Verrucomicrobiota bacterium]